jgi:methylthioribose-1-phosphate isomerase
MTASKQLEAIKYTRGSLQLLDQRLLPLQQTFLDIQTCEDAHARIKEMAVRGAPAIAIAGFLALAVELQNAGAGAQFTDAAHASQAIQERAEYLVTRCWPVPLALRALDRTVACNSENLAMHCAIQASMAQDRNSRVYREFCFVCSRPTAVNLLDTARKLRALLNTIGSAPDATAASVTTSVIEFAEKMQQDDIDANMAIGAFGMEAMLAAAASTPSGKISVLTHCNTGSLATVRYGTALGCIRALRDAGKLEHAFCTETRYTLSQPLVSFTQFHLAIFRDFTWPP